MASMIIAMEGSYLNGLCAGLRADLCEVSVKVEIDVSRITSSTRAKKACVGTEHKDDDRRHDQSDFDGLCVLLLASLSSVRCM